MVYFCSVLFIIIIIITTNKNEYTMDEERKQSKPILHSISTFRHPLKVNKTPYCSFEISSVMTSYPPHEKDSEVRGTG